MEGMFDDNPTLRWIAGTCLVIVLLVILAAAACTADMEAYNASLPESPEGIGGEKPVEVIPTRIKPTAEPTPTEMPPLPKVDLAKEENRPEEPAAFEKVKRFFAGLPEWTHNPFWWTVTVGFVLAVLAGMIKLYYSVLNR